MNLIFSVILYNLYWHNIDINRYKNVAAFGRNQSNKKFYKMFKQSSSLLILSICIAVACNEELPPVFINFKNRTSGARLLGAVSKMNLDEIMYSWWLQEYYHLEKEHEDDDYIIIQ